MKTKIENILREILPSQCFIKVWDSKSCFGGVQIGITFSVLDYDINNVRGQKPQMVSLLLDPKEMELTTQVFGGNGGGSIVRQPNLENDSEKYLCMKSVKIPFRKPKKEEKFVLAAIKRFAENWLKVLTENKEVLMYQDLVDYDTLLK